MAPTKKNNAFYKELTILKIILRHREPANKFNLTSAITTLPLPTLPYMLLSDVNNQLSSSLACKAANFWPFLTIVFVFLVAFCYIYAART